MPAPTPAIIGPIRPRIRASGASGPPNPMYFGEVAYSAPDDIFYVGANDDGTGVATLIVSIAGKGAFLAKALLGAASGIAPLGPDGKVPVANLPAAVLGAMQYQGTWNANTNTPALASGAGTKGFFYKVSVAGTTALDGNASWQVGDLVLFDGTTWDGIDGNASEVLSVAGRAGAVVLSSADISDATAVGKALIAAATIAAAKNQLLIDGFVSANDVNSVLTAANVSVGYSAITAARTVTLPALATMNPGQRLRVRDLSGNCSTSLSITLTPNGSEKINGAASFALNQPYQSVEIEAGGGAWAIIALYPPPASNNSGGVSGGSY